MNKPVFKFTAGDTVWYMDHNKACSAMIVQHRLYSLEKSPYFRSSYKVDLNYNAPEYPEELLFESKQKLLESL